MKGKAGQVRAIIFLLGVFVVLLFSLQCKNNSPSVADDTHLPYRNLSDSVQYVGINTCKQCHQEIYNTFIQTGMGKSFDFATHQKSAALFDKHALVHDAFKNLYYKPFWRHDSLFSLEFRLEGRDTVYRHIQYVKYIVGSGQHTNSHMMTVNGFLYQVPMTFYTQKGHWDLPPGFENGANTRFSREIGLECMSCHNSYPDYVKGSENRYTDIPQGINCERCHGPGSLHVSDKKAGKLVDINTTVDYSIVNPAKLPVDLQFEICQRCHLQGNAVLNEGKSFYDFKPGMRLSEVMNVFMPVYKGRENEHIMASHVERLKMSQCFIQTMKKVEDGSIKVTDKLKPYKDALTCVTCHNPHVSVTITGKEIFNNACRKCHDGVAQQVCNRPELNDKHTVDGNCVSCHMPKSNTIDIPHVISTDHYIRKPLPVGEINKVKTYLGIKCINNPKPEAGTIARAYIQYFEKFDSQPSALDSAKHYLPDNTPEAVKHNFKNLVYLSYVKKDYATVVKYADKVGFKAVTDGQTESWSNDDAWTDYRIGHSYYNLGKYDEAKQYLQLSTVLASSNLEFKNQLGATFIALGENQEAMQVYATIIRENPNMVAALSNYGYTLLITNNDAQHAEEYYNKALALDPDYEQALLNKAGLKIYKQEHREAQQLLKRIIKKNPNNVQAKDLLLKLSSL